MCLLYMYTSNTSIQVLFIFFLDNLNHANVSDYLQPSVRFRYRKLHLLEEKEAIESAIGYNHTQFPDTLPDPGGFASPDTICKYCGKDFRYFRALKHHLRSHSSCRLKPYICRLCSNGFSTKANCMRHLQKQHPEIEQNQMERQILIQEFLPEGEQQQTEQPGNSSSSRLPFSIGGVPRKLDYGGGMQTGSDSAGRCNSQAVNSYLWFSNRDIGDRPANGHHSNHDLQHPQDKPLDFTIKTLNNEAMRYTSATPHRENGLVQRQGGDQPIDLSGPRSRGDPVNDAKPKAFGSSAESRRPMNLPLPVLDALSPTDIAMVTPNMASCMKLPVVDPSQCSPTLEPSTQPSSRCYDKLYNPLTGCAECPQCRMPFKEAIKVGHFEAVKV